MSKETKKVEEKKVDNTEEILQKVMEVLNAFMQQELGNKITQFNIQGLSQLIVMSVTQKEE